MWFIRPLAMLAAAIAAALGATYAVVREDPVQKAAMGVRYTQHVSRAARADIIVLRLAGNFSELERAHIANAANQWNHVLNGYIRFEIDPAAPTAAQGVPPATVSIVRSDGLAPPGPNAMAIALTVALPRGAVIVVFGPRLDRARLDRVMMHELGHALGLPQLGSRGYLMSPTYSGTDQICIDKATVEEVAALRGLPLNELNWCLF